jgi:hypothetical protein
MLSTLVIIKSPSGNVFGGYTEQSWHYVNFTEQSWAQGSFKIDPKTFIFSLNGQSVK